MPSIRNADDRRQILARLRSLSRDARPLWGSFTAPRMLCHLGDQLRVALGAIPVLDRSSLLSRTLGQWLIVYTPLQAPPGKAMTAPEMLLTQPTTWTQDMVECERLVERAAVQSAASLHPKFGRLSPNGWGRLAWKHLDHHLRQFGA